MARGSKRLNEVRESLVMGTTGMELGGKER